MENNNNNKCMGCGTAETVKKGICDLCWQEVSEFHDTLGDTKKRRCFNIMDLDDRWTCYKKCKGKPRRKQLHIIRNYFNRCGYRSHYPNSSGKHWRVKV